jgi:hypothetical protein
MNAEIDAAHKKLIKKCATGSKQQRPKNLKQGCKSTKSNQFLVLHLELN